MHLNLPQYIQDELFEDHKQRRTRARNGWRALEKHPIMSNGKVKTKRRYSWSATASRPASKRI